MFSAGFNQKTVKEDIFVKANHVYPQQDQCGRTLEDSRRQTTVADHMFLTCGAGWLHLQAGWPMGPTCHPLFRMTVLHCLKDQIYAIVLSQFDLRV
jgi:hypothetical protein